jgi:hypothetical protein
MIFEDVCTRREYEVNGIKKTVWLKCGTLRTNDAGKRYIELNQNPYVTLYVFPKKENTEQPVLKVSQQSQTTEEAWLNEDQQ